jgi:hypothetical protein
MPEGSLVDQQICSMILRIFERGAQIEAVTISYVDTAVKCIQKVTSSSTSSSPSATLLEEMLKKLRRIEQACFTTHPKSSVDVNNANKTMDTNVYVGVDRDIHLVKHITSSNKVALTPQHYHGLMSHLLEVAQSSAAGTGEGAMKEVHSLLAQMRVANFHVDYDTVERLCWAGWEWIQWGGLGPTFPRERWLSKGPKSSCCGPILTRGIRRVTSTR